MGPVDVSDFDIEKYLSSKGLTVKHSGSQLHTHCMFCNEDPGKRGRFYINNTHTEYHGLWDCVGGDTEVITWDGVRSIRDLSGRDHKILTSGGRWTTAPVRSFGKRNVMVVTVSRNGVRKTIDATPGHRWIVRGRSQHVEYTTAQLRTGHRLAYSFGQGVGGSVRPSAVGVMAGLVFGDGHKSHTGSKADIYDDELLPFFSALPVIQRLTGGGVPFWQVSDLPSFFKDRPDINESRSYLFGWLAGYFAADGTVSKSGQVVMQSADLEALRFVRDLCVRIGVGTYEVRGPYVGKDRFNDGPMYGLAFLGSTLKAEFFLLDRHRTRFEARDPSFERKGWVVDSVEVTDRVEEVFCAVVEGTETFTLAGNLLTGNCKVCGTKGNLRTLMRFYGDSMEEAPVDERSMRITNAAANFYHSLLSPQHRETLYARGLTDETINKFRLGFAPGQGVLFEHLKDKFNTDEIVATGYCGVDRKSGEIYDFFRNEFTIPYLAHGIAQQIRGRAADPAVESNKYRTPPGGPVRLFNVDAAWSAETLIITEGEFDAMILDQLGFSAVGVPGATGWKATFLGYIKTAKRIWVMYDPDQDGQKNAVKVADALGARAMNVELPVPEGTEAKRVDPSYLVSSMGWEKKNFDDLLASVNRRASLLITPREAHEQWKGLQGKDGVKLGFENLDHAIAPGLLAGQIMIPLAKTNTGKAQPVWEMVLTPDGWRSMGSIVPGDSVVGSDGKSTLVQGVYPQGVRRTASVTLSDNTKIRCDLDHLWTWHSRSSLPLRTSTTQDLKKRVDKGLKVYLPMPEPIVGSNVLLPVDPYTLGALLGDGGFRHTVHITTNDPEILDNMTLPEGMHVRGRVSGKGVGEYDLAIKGQGNGNGNPIKAALKDLGLWGSYSYEKFVPGIYLSAQWSDRLAVLQGLLDTDGSVDIRGSIEYSTSSNQLALDVMDLVLSLGGSVGTGIRSRVTASGRIGYRISLRLPSGLTPFRLRRKVERLPVDGKPPMRSVKSITEATLEECVCLKVAAEDSLYVTNGYALTHNTLILLNIFQRASMIDPNLKILFLSLEQNSGDWFERARRIWNFYNIECEPWKVHEETINYWEPRLRLVEKSRPSEEEFNLALDDYEEEMGEPPGLVAVDYLGYWAQGFKAKDRYEKVTDAVMALKQLAGDRKVPIISPHQVNRGAEFGAELQIDQARDSGAVEETADFAIGMWSPDTMKGVGTKSSPVEPSGELVLRIGKSRHGGKGKEFRLQFGQLTLVFVPYEEADNRDKLKRELKWAESPTNTWEDAIDVHRNGGTFGVGL